MNLLTVLFAFALAIAVLGLAYRLAVMYLIAPKVLRKYGVQDARSQLWISRVERLCNRRVLFGFAIIIIICLLELSWEAIKVHVV